jgi:hypothetical protein
MNTARFAAATPKAGPASFNETDPQKIMSFFFGASALPQEEIARSDFS